MKQEIQALLDEQLSTWELAGKNYAALNRVRVKEVCINGYSYKVQFNPARIVSSAAKVDTQSIQERKCFLCPANLPAAQKGLPFGSHYQILVNPFPIFPKHLTIPELEHTDQRIRNRFGDMLDLAAVVNNYVIFYNGPKCGASAPDHAHFQAGSKGFLPIEQQWEKQKADKVVDYQKATLWYLNEDVRATLVIESYDKESALHLFDVIYRAMEVKPGEEEPMMNILLWKEADKWIIFIFPRELHRPSCYTAGGEANMLISPASVDMGGVFITPLEKDFEKITANDITGILSEVCLSPEKSKELKQRVKELL